MNGIVVSGSTASADFPVTPNAPGLKMGSSRDIFFAFFDRDLGQLRSATYSGIDGAASLRQQVVDSSGDIGFGGGYASGTLDTTESLGYLLRWRPLENQFVFSLRFASPVTSLVFDGNSNLYFASLKLSSPSSGLTSGLVNASGKQQGSLVTINAPAEFGDAEIFPNGIRLLPVGNGEFWAVYPVRVRQGYSVAPGLFAAKISPASGQAIFNRRLANSGFVAELAITPAGNIKLLLNNSTPTEVTTQDAPLVAGCRDTSYFAIVSPSAQLVFATYVPTASFEFATQTETRPSTPANLSCFASTAGRFPLVDAAPGQLITLTGGGFGPASPIYSEPDSSGMYPLTSGGFRVRIAGMDAHIIAIARGLIAVQVPYEDVTLGSIEVFYNGSPLNPLPFSPYGRPFGLFDTGDRNNSLNLPALAALNQDGKVNSKSNPAIAGSIVSLFGTGLGPLSPGLTSGGLSPIPPAAPLSESSLFRLCAGCEILYLGSAPGLSTGVVQANVRIVADETIGGVRPHGIGIAVSGSVRGMLPPSLAGVVFIK